jgi:hypothetical protein
MTDTVGYAPFRRRVHDQDNLALQLLKVVLLLGRKCCLQGVKAGGSGSGGLGGRHGGMRRSGGGGCCCRGGNEGVTRSRWSVSTGYSCRERGSSLSQSVTARRGYKALQPRRGHAVVHVTFSTSYSAIPIRPTGMSSWCYFECRSLGEVGNLSCPDRNEAETIWHHCLILVSPCHCQQLR